MVIRFIIKRIDVKSNFSDPFKIYQLNVMGRYIREMQLMLTSMANNRVQTNIWDQDQTAPMRSGSILIASKTSLNNELVDDLWVVM